MKSISVFLAVALSLAACAYRPGLDENPMTRRATWFSYVEGGDMRAACLPGRDVYRLVYNGRYTEQVRMYELTDSTLSARAVDEANLTNVTTDDLLAPWRGKSAQVTLGADQKAQLLKSFADSGMFSGPPVGLELPSDDFFWTAAWCRGGEYGFTAWLHPSPRFAAVTFPKALLALDRTGVAYNAPREIPINVLDRKRPDDAKVTFQLRVAEKGLWGIRPLF